MFESTWYHSLNHGVILLFKVKTGLKLSQIYSAQQLGSTRDYQATFLASQVSRWTRRYFWLLFYCYIQLFIATRGRCSSEDDDWKGTGVYECISFLSRLGTVDISKLGRRFGKRCSWWKVHLPYGFIIL